MQIFSELGCYQLTSSDFRKITPTSKASAGFESHCSPDTSLTLLGFKSKTKSIARNRSLIQCKSHPREKGSYPRTPASCLWSNYSHRSVASYAPGAAKATPHMIHRMSSGSSGWLQRARCNTDTHLSAVVISIAPLNPETSMELSKENPIETPDAVCPGFQPEEERNMKGEPCTLNSYPKVELVQGWGLWQPVQEMGNCSWAAQHGHNGKPLDTYKWGMENS